MIATINDKEKTITLECSFTYSDFQEFFRKLPPEWQEFEFKIGEGKQNWIPNTWTGTTYPIYYPSYYLTGSPVIPSGDTTSCCGGDCQAKSE